MPRRLVIAIDCDDVLIPSTEYIVAAYNKLFGTSVTVARAHESGNDQWGTTDSALVMKRLSEIQLSEGYATQEPLDEAIIAVRALAADHELHLVTARDKQVEAVTLAMLDQYLHGCFSSVEHVGKDRSKGEVCRELRADVLIDDNTKHLVSALEQGLQVGGAIRFGDYQWNETVELPAGAVHCTTWADIQREVENIAGR